MNALKTKISREVELLSLNEHIVRQDQQQLENGTKYYSVYLPKLNDGGATVIIGDMSDSISLEPPATVEFKEVKVYPHQVVYRLAFNLEEALACENDDAKYKTFISPVLTEAVRRFVSTFGDPSITRYGDHYIKVADVLDLNGEYLEVRLTGLWASNKEVENNGSGKKE